MAVILQMLGETDILSPSISGQHLAEILHVTHLQTEKAPQLYHCGLQLEISLAHICRELNALQWTQKDTR